MKIRTQLVITFVVIITLIGALTVYNINNSTMLSTTTDKLYKHPYTVSTEVISIRGKSLKSTET